jgi:hypothetical protein
MKDKLIIEKLKEMCFFLDEHLEDDLSPDNWKNRHRLYDELAALESNEPVKEVTAEEIIQELQNSNPYPEDVFTSMTTKELKSIIRLLKVNGYSTDCLYGNWGRKVWNNCVNKVRELFEEYTQSQPEKPRELTDGEIELEADVQMKGHRVMDMTRREGFFFGAKWYRDVNKNNIFK